MLRKSVELCPDDLWLSSEYQNRFWHVAYHALFYTHFYVQPSEAEFKAWTKHVPNSNFLGQTPEPYAKPDILEYSQLCRSEVEKQVPLPSLEAASGFHWLPLDKFDLQLYNIRHLQHHAGQLIDRLRTSANIGIGWIRAS